MGVDQEQAGVDLRIDGQPSRGAVGQESAQLRQRHLVGGDLLAGVAAAGPDAGERTRLKERDRLVDDADGDGPLGQGDHLARCEPGLLEELSFRRHDQALARIEVPREAGRQLDHSPSHGRAVLFDQQQLAVLGDGHDDDDPLDVGAGDVLPPGVVQ